MNKKEPFGYAVKFAVAATLSILIIFALGFTFTSYLKSKNSSTPLPVFDNTDKIRFVIDAGHGGEDAGAVAADGTLEKDLNLKISTLLASILELNGNRVTLTRKNDSLLYDKYGDLEDYTGKKKVYDLKNRLRLAEEHENSIYVGIHMNKFPLEKYSGLQVYYSPNNELSYQIATDVQSTVQESLQAQNKRSIKRADSSIFILHKAKIPAVLIECGFLSNQNELALLRDGKYQLSLALNLFSALSGYGK